MPAEVLAVIMLGASFCSFVFMAAMAGKMNELAKTYKAQLRYNYHQIDIEKRKAKQGGVELVEE